ncbi:hypothetical protein MLD38_032613 [Melastoma candidum]|uniref:Uncharacterized protein n=1 Tax=Melastoma candidum TaxID=119954 RepID=A0ACB9M7V2_9MYRT|nr:hypothetical protein MLD38_032613 [Melastoma candidum]
MLVRAHFPHHQAWIYHPHYLAGYYNLRKLPLHYPNPLPPPIRHEDKAHLPSEKEMMASEPRPSVPPSLENKRWMKGRGLREVRRSAPTEAPGTATQAESSFCGLSSGVTTIMIRNLPNVFRRDDVLDILDKHCREVNSKLDEAMDDDATASREQKVRSEYDFVYLPFDFRQNMNLGYAFVNFTTPIAAARMFHVFHGWGWKGYWYEARRCPLNSRKVCQINPASIQGRAALVHHLGKRGYPREEFQPVAAMEKPCNGIGRQTHLVGSHCDVVGPLRHGRRRRWKHSGH